MTTIYLPEQYILHFRYRILQVLGQGGFGITYLAHDQQLDVPVCVKELFIAGSSTRSANMTVQSQSLGENFSFADFIDRFLDEARQLARFNHPNIVRVTNVFESNNTAYMVMEYVHGQTLKAMIERIGALPEKPALQLFGQLLDAVEVVHQMGMLHRDIKPDNILVTQDNKVVLIDFGSAREFAEGKTTTQTAMLTPGYAPIEQYSNRAQRGTFTDIYALGATLYYVLTGEKPIPATDRNLETLVSPHERNNQVSPQLSSAVLMAMEMRPEDRFQGVGDLRQAIVLLQEQEQPRQQDPVQQVTIPSASKSTKERTNSEGENRQRFAASPNKSVNEKNRKWWLVPVVMCIVLVVVVAMMMLPSDEGSTEGTLAENEVSYKELTSYGGTYIPVDEEPETASFRLVYFDNPGANRATCEIVFNDGYEIFTNSSCAGEYFWCLLDADFNEMGSMKLVFTIDGAAASISIKEGQGDRWHKKYLSALEGEIKRVETAEELRNREEEEKQREAEQLAEQQRLEQEAEQKRLDEEQRRQNQSTNIQRPLTFSSLRDIAGNEYQAVTIGSQVWMAENLNVDRFRNGDPIPEAKTVEEWIKAGQEGRPAWCYYDNNPANGGTYGKLYNWYAVSDQRGICPVGWDVPLDAEWTILTNYLGGSEIAGTKMKSKNGWYNGGNGTNTSGFSGLPGGYRYFEVGSFSQVDKFGYWWSSGESSSYNAPISTLSHRDALTRYPSPKTSGFSIRCLRD